MKPINHVELFAGIGGMSLGLLAAGIKFKKHYFSEVDPYAIKVHKKHFPEAIELGDITKITGKEISKTVDILSGGFPCQNISVAGKQEGIEASRSGLFFEIIRLAETLSPRIIFMENVSALLGSNEGRDMGTVLRELAQIGYDAEWNCIPASYVSAPHRRDRIWIVAYAKRLRLEKFSSRHRECKKVYFGGCSAALAAFITIKRIYRQRNFTNIRRGNGVPSRVDRLKCLGNAVVPQVVTYIAEIIIKPILEDMETKGGTHDKSCTP